jgi:hypothetical protein
MRGSLWAFAVVAVFLGVMTRAINTATPSSPSATTAGVESVLGVLAPFAGVAVLLVGVGALFSLATR